MKTTHFILNQLNFGYLTRDHIRDICKKELGRDMATTDRKLRELTEEDKIRPHYKGKFIVGYHKVDEFKQEQLSGIDLYKTHN